MKKISFVFILFILFLQCYGKYGGIERPSPGEIENEKEEDKLASLLMILDILNHPLINPYEIHINVKNKTAQNITVDFYINKDGETNCSLKLLLLENVENAIFTIEEEASIEIMTRRLDTINEFYIGIESLGLCCDPIPMYLKPYKHFYYTCEITTSNIFCYEL
ncbi:MAG: hypothetical protein KatS3mg129_3179 [Leptospiraceae bacterium]|nr:MAG: hypothetical protein KatS3mg129_3179 [Leptospiraceae bacterium]